MSNYLSMTKRIKAAKTISDLNKLRLSLVRVYDTGQFTVSEFKRLDIKIIDKIISIESA